MSYWLISSFVLILSMIPLAIHYKRKKLKAREVVLIAMMSALSVVANLISAYTIPLHAGTSLVILSGIGLGAEAGFLVGALARFVCNFFMGQGMWTPWQMMAWGLIGAISGIAFSKVELIGHFTDKKELLKSNINTGLRASLEPLVIIIFSELIGFIIYLFTRDEGEGFFGFRLYVFGLIGILIYIIIHKRKIPTNVVTVSIFTFVVVFVIYGGIMNFAALITSSTFIGGGKSYISLESLKLMYITGIPYDLSHAFAASICSFLMCDGITQKLERIKIKYGMY